MSKSKKRKRASVRPIRDRHLLYTAAVQSVEADLDFFQRVYRRKRQERFRTLREDFCGTAALACEWVKRRDDHRAWGIDLDAKTLEWGRQRYVSKLGPAADRIELIRRDVLARPEPRADVIAALNFSYSVFKTRDRLAAYFSRVRQSLNLGGMLFLDAFGGTEAIIEDVENRRIAASIAQDGTRVPAFTYIWEQARFNPITHEILCYIHFKLPGGKRLNRAFTYDWRLWTLPEMQELLIDAGFDSAEVYVEGWDEEEDDTDGIFRRRKTFENQSGWVAYVVGLT